MEVEFRNMTIKVLNVSSAKEAYELLCNGLGSMPGIEFTSDTYVAFTGERDHDMAAEERDTADLWED